MQGYATISECGTFRYRLGRRWDFTLPALLFVLFNPSTADAILPDRTVKKCIAFAKAQGYGAIEIVNCYAYRTKLPKELRAAGYPVGPENFRHIREAVAESSAVCLAWGALAADLGQPQAVLTMLRMLGVKPLCLRITKSGHPEHPLYLPGNLKLRPFGLQAITDAMQGEPA